MSVNNNNISGFILKIIGPAIGFMIPGIILAIIGVHMLFAWYAIECWPRASGTIISSRMERDSEGDYCVFYVYHYKANGEELSNDVYSPDGGLSFNDEETASEYILKEGAEVPVFINPDNPSQSYLQNTPFESPIVVICVSVLLFGVGVGVLISIFRSE
ncbi:MAG: DUF3592 domain-containing protein [Spirochaetales bacterium]|nr:DUF3592 domain-containing protein [Spirochaetales bacterium]